jgi:hypothetical protein
MESKGGSVFEDASTTKRVGAFAWPAADFKILLNVIPQLVISSPRL